MTKKDAIIRLSRLSFNELKQERKATPIVEALDMAIEALSEPSYADLYSTVEEYFQGLWPGTETAEQCNTDLHFTPPAILRLAEHFYNLGKQSKRECSSI